MSKGIRKGGNWSDHTPFQAAKSSLQLLSGGDLILRLRGASKLTLSHHPSFTSTRPSSDAYEATTLSSTRSAVNGGSTPRGGLSTIIDAQGTYNPRLFPVSSLANLRTPPPRTEPASPRETTVPARLPYATTHPDSATGVFRAKLPSLPPKRSPTAPNRSPTRHLSPQIHTNSPESARHPPRTLVVEMKQKRSSDAAAAAAAQARTLGCGGPNSLSCGAPFSRPWWRAICAALPVLCATTFSWTRTQHLH
ncbi:hypothetical protein HU200_045174 [Digitaria exilis]|uniref:Uncharacterized protein n=1 Tax=Digitaria exilis TaxID=1010633 RepID=A0A835B2U5_9POAL|nr:hypothetical protein HU200_045174 [Digitaria exilis]